MYRTIEETAEKLRVPAALLWKYIEEGKVRAVHDGKTFLVNEGQFNFDQIEEVRRQIEDYYHEPIPPDRDIKDED